MGASAAMGRRRGEAELAVHTRAMETSMSVLVALEDRRVASMIGHPVLARGTPVALSAARGVRIASSDYTGGVGAGLLDDGMGRRGTLVARVIARVGLRATACSNHGVFVDEQPLRAQNPCNSGWTTADEEHSIVLEQGRGRRLTTRTKP